MRFFLMQRNHPVAVIEIAEKTGDIIDVAEVLSAQRIPLGAKHSDGSFDVLSLRKWWAGRGIPASRSGLERALETLHIPYAELLLEMQRAEPFRPVLGHALRCPTELARCKFLRERLF